MEETKTTIIKSDGGAEMSESRLQKLEGRTYHIDGKVAAIETQLGTQGAQLTRIEQHMLAPKPPVNYGVWVGIALTILFGLGSMLAAMSGYLDIQLNNLRSVVDDVQEDIESHRLRAQVEDDRNLEAAFAAGVHSGKLEDIQASLIHLDEREHKMDERLRLVEREAAAGTVSRRAIGDYTKELGGRVDELH